MGEEEEEEKKERKKKKRQITTIHAIFFLNLKQNKKTKN